MKVYPALLTAFIATVLLSSCSDNALKKAFKEPANEFRPQPFLHLNGHLDREHIYRQFTEARDSAGFGGIAILPVSSQPHWYDGHPCPGMTPEYMSEEYFARYEDMLEISRRNGTDIILYDDIDFPSGSAGGRLVKKYPQYTRKYLEKQETDITGGRHCRYEFAIDSTMTVMAVSALETDSRETVDLGPYLSGNVLDWDAPAGKWKIMLFTCRYGVGGVHGHLVDYMQPEAVDTLMKMTYGEYDSRFSGYFGNVIRKTFFDDVGFVHMEQTWTPAITDIFREKYGLNPALYYPALFYDIGPETGKARIAFYDIRAELMAEGYVKTVSEWAETRHMKSMGHPPENYSPNTVVASGDILKFYRHVDIPLLDAILYFRRGLNGFKQVSSAADLYDRPVVGAELCGAYPADMDSLMMYRITMEALARGVNFTVPHGMWYDTDPSTVRIPPLIAPENPLLNDALKNYSLSTGRSCMLLQGGRRVADIAVLWPIQSVQAESWMFRDQTSGLPIANWVPENVVNYTLSDILTNRLHRDFTYIHPENLADGKVAVNGKTLLLNNKENIQEYRILIIPGGDHISADALKGIYRFYDNGGKVIVLASLPTRSSEFGRDMEVTEMMHNIFGAELPSRDTVVTGRNGGMFIFSSSCNADDVSEALDLTGYKADAIFPDAAPDNAGYINYLHKVRDERNFYYITNTTDTEYDGTVSLRGEFRKVEIWDPHTGNTGPADFRIQDGRTYVSVSVPSVRSCFIVTK